MRHKDHRGTSHTIPCLQCYEKSIAEIEALWLSCIEIWNVCLTSEFSVFSIMAGLITGMLFLLLFAYIAV